MTAAAQRVYLVDDDVDVREALALLLRTVGVKVDAFPDGRALLERLDRSKPGCLVVDIRMPFMSGLQLQERLVAAGCDWPIIVITGHGDVEACRRAFKSGAVDFLTKPIDEQVLIDAVQAAFAVLEARLTNTAERSEAHRLVASLTPREREILDFVTRGWATKEIARSLDVSPRTVETHRAHIAEKLGTTSVAEMVRLSVAAQT